MESLDDNGYPIKRVRLKFHVSSIWEKGCSSCLEDIL